MKLLLVVATLCVLICGMHGDEMVVSESINNFSNALYQAVKAGSDNLVVSPFSVHAVVAMLLLGLQGNTEKQVTKALFLPEDRSQTAQGFKSIFTSLQASQDEGLILEIANKIYIQSGFDVKEKFLKDTADYFNSVTEEVDIAGKTEEVRLAVNNWAANKTHDKIKDLLAPGTLPNDAVLILLNAIYFKGLWKAQFDKELTEDKPFNLTLDSQKDVPTMYLESVLPYTELLDLNVQVLKLPYKGDKFSMLIFLPRETDGLEELESNFDKVNISEIQKTFYDTEIIVELPRFKILNTIDLEGPFTKLGMDSLFQRGGNFSGITDVELRVSKALQKAFIEVNEEGTEAAAVSALIAIWESVETEQPSKQYFIADHPFMYLLVAEEKNTILFMGRVMDPTAKSAD